MSSYIRQSSTMFSSSVLSCPDRSFPSDGLQVEPGPRSEVVMNVLPLHGHMKKVRFFQSQELCLASVCCSTSGCVGLAWFLSAPDSQSHQRPPTWLTLCQPPGHPSAIRSDQTVQLLLSLRHYPNLVLMSVTGVSLSKDIIVSEKLNWTAWGTTLKNAQWSKLGSLWCQKLRQVCQARGAPQSLLSHQLLLRVLYTF